MTSEQTPWGKILVLDADAARANDFGRCLGYLNYEAVLADAEATADVCQDALAIVVGGKWRHLSALSHELNDARQVFDVFVGSKLEGANGAVGMAPDAVLVEDWGNVLVVGGTIHKLASVGLPLAATIGS